MAITAVTSQDIIHAICEKISMYASMDLEGIMLLNAFKVKAERALKLGKPLIYLDDVECPTEDPILWSANSPAEIIDEIVLPASVWDMFLHAAIIEGTFVGYPVSAKNTFSPICEGRKGKFIVTSNFDKQYEHDMFKIIRYCPQKKRPSK